MPILSPNLVSSLWLTRKSASVEHISAVLKRPGHHACKQNLACRKNLDACYENFQNYWLSIYDINLSRDYEMLLFSCDNTFYLARWGIDWFDAHGLIP